MGQRGATRPRGRETVESLTKVRFCAFSSACGWMGLAGRNGRVCGLLLGHSDRRAVMDRAAAQWGDHWQSAEWAPDLVARLQAYLQGAVDNFSDVELELPDSTPFQQAVRSAVRRIPYGQTASYAEIARQAGSPRAARAVGGVMASNQIPILIPCHRVVASGGKLGGFSAPRGVDLKRWLLEREGCRLGN